LFTHLRLGLPSGLFPSGFLTNIVHAFLFSPSELQLRYRNVIFLRLGVTLPNLRTILTALLYGCETWSLILWGKPRVLENRVLERVSGAKRDEITVCGASRTLSNKELDNCDPSSDIIRMISSRRIRWAGHAV
jgi:hypothetical protein